MQTAIGITAMSVHTCRPDSSDDRNGRRERTALFDSDNKIVSKSKAPVVIGRQQNNDDTTKAAGTLLDAGNSAAAT